MLADGRLHLSGIEKLAPHLTDENYEAVLARATHQSKRRIEEPVAELAPKPDVRPSIRKLPNRRAKATPGQEKVLGPDQPLSSTMSSPLAVEVTTGPKISSSAVGLTTNSKRNVIMGRR
jgi:hypothetical protein